MPSKLIRLSVKEQYDVAPGLQKMFLRILSELGLEYSYAEGDYVLIMKLDAAAVTASRFVKNFYPPDIAELLFNKETMPGLLATYGSPVLAQRNVQCVDDIGDMQDFILKPSRCAFGPSGSLDKTKVAYKKYHNADEVRAQLPVEKANKELATGFIAQEADMAEVSSEVGFHGTVNAKGEAYFCRTSTGTWTHGQLISNRRDWGGFDAERAMVRAVIKGTRIRNASFNTHFVRRKDGALCPIDWNLRMGLGILHAADEINYLEIKRAVAHQFDVPTDLPDQFPGVWESTGFMNGHPINTVLP